MKPLEHDLATWPTKQEAAQVIGVSSKTVEKYASEGKLQSARRKQAGRPDAVVYHPDDVGRVAREREQSSKPGAFLVPKPAVSEVGEAVGEHFSNGLGQLSQLLAGALREASEKPSEKLFLSVKEASERSGLTQRYLREQIQAGTLEAIQDGRRTRIRKRDLEGL